MGYSSERQLLRRREIEGITGLGASLIHESMRNGLPPRSRCVPGTPGAVAWLASEVDAWVEALPGSDPRDGPAKKREAASVCPPFRPLRPIPARTTRSGPDAGGGQ